MKNCFLVLVFLITTIGTGTFGEDKTGSLFSLQISPGMSIPLGRDVALFRWGGGALISGELALPFLPLVYLSADVGYNFIPTLAGTDLSLLEFGGGIGLDLSPLPRVSLQLYGRGGYFFGFLHDGTDSGNNPFLAGGTGVQVRLSPLIGIGVDVAYRNFLGLQNDIRVGIGAVFNVVPARRGGGAIQEQIPPGGIPDLTTEQGLEIPTVEFATVFPIFYKHYDDKPIGKAVLKNTLDKPLENIEVTFLVKQYMDNPKACPAPQSLAPGKEAEIDLYALFTNSVLQITEGSKVSSQIIAQFTVAGKRYRREVIKTLEIQNRNAITWDDDRKVAAFVTAKDSTVQRLAKNTTGLIKDRMGRAVDKNLVLAMGLFTAYCTHGMSYAADPTTPYAELSKSKQAVDFLQFPKQSLEYKAGDCDDLSVLFASLLESVGVESAFITVPGHIFAAFALETPAENARSTFLAPDDLIFVGDRAWVPIEVTEIQGGFMKAWQLGAKEWREGEARKQAKLYPTREAWTLYQPVGLDLEKAEITMSDQQQLVGAFDREFKTFINREIYPRVGKLQAEIASTSKNLGAVNRLGVLYAQYGLDDQAEAEFRKILQREENAPALINLGNLMFLKGRMDEALKLYGRADAASPDNPTVLLCLARANHEIENYGSVKTAYDRLKKLNPDLAARFAYLDLRGEEATRAADITQVRNVVIWEEGQK
jgi:hypothetical protein